MLEIQAGPTRGNSSNRSSSAHMQNDDDPNFYFSVTPAGHFLGDVTIGSILVVFNAVFLTPLPAQPLT
jgi:hypothetical protein